MARVQIEVGVLIFLFQNILFYSPMNFLSVKFKDPHPQGKTRA